MRRALCRALNQHNAEYFGEFSDRMTPAAVIPMHTPEEAIEELEHCGQGSGPERSPCFQPMSAVPTKALVKDHPDLALKAGSMDFYALDSDYDYDPVWAKCLELKISPPCIPRAWLAEAGSHTSTSCTTTSGISPEPPMACARHCSSAG